MKGLIIFGSSTLARLAHYYATKELNLDVQGFVVDDEYFGTPSYLSLPVTRWSEFRNLGLQDEVSLHVAVGYRIMRARVSAFDRVRALGYQLQNIMSTSAYIAQDVILGDNNLIMPGAVLETGVAIGSNNVVWSNATLCHDCACGSHNFIAANVTVGGGVKIGNANFLGFGSVLLQGIRIGDETLLGAQSLVLHNTKDRTRYHGVPVREIGPVDPVLGIRVA